MASQLSIATEGAALDAITGSADFIKYPGTYLALLTTDMADRGAGTGGVECADTNYVRLPVTWGAKSGTSPVTKLNTNEMKFFGTGAAASQIIVGWALYTAATGGTYITSCSVTSKTVAIGSLYDVAVGDVSLALT